MPETESLPEPASAQAYAFKAFGGAAAHPSGGAVRDWQPAFEIMPAAEAGLPDSVHAQARASGYAVGWAQGMREAREQLAGELEQVRLAAAEQQRRLDAEVRSGLAALARAAADFEARMTPAVEQVEQAAITMAVEIAQAVLGHELRRRGDRDIINSVARVLSLTPSDQPVTIELSTADHAALTSALSTPQTLADFGGGRELALVASPALGPGDAIALYGTTEIDARIEPALRRAREALEA